MEATGGGGISCQTAPSEVTTVLPSPFGPEQDPSTLHSLKESEQRHLPATLTPPNFSTKTNSLPQRPSLSAATVSPLKRLRWGVLMRRQREICCLPQTFPPAPEFCLSIYSIASESTMDTGKTGAEGRCCPLWRHRWKSC